MTLLYVDTSAVVRAYLREEPDHEALRTLLFDGDIPVVSSELTRVELASAVHSAHRAHRIADPRPVLARFDADCGEEGPITLLRLDASRLLPVARRLVADCPLRTMGALHLATAVTEARALVGEDEPVVMVTRDRRQGEAAVQCGLVVR